MPRQRSQLLALSYIPYTKSAVPRATDGDGSTMQDAQAPDGGGVTAKFMDASAVSYRHCQRQYHTCTCHECHVYHVKRLTLREAPTLVRSCRTRH
jgi:hypothetical protein